MTIRKFKCDSVLLPDGWACDVVIHVDAAGLIAEIMPGSDGEHVSGIVIAGMANLHSHAHQRLMQGLAERAGPGADSFWTWREVMYSFALKLGPEDLQAVAAQAYAEMLCAGFTSVGEFQYLHHQPDGTPYANRAELSLRCLAAAEDVGIAATMLPVLYSHGGFGGQAPNAGQRRFINDTAGFIKIYEGVQKAVHGHHRLGVAPHSLRAVTKLGLDAVLAATPEQQPIHIHIAEQTKEVDDCLAWCGQRPVDYLLQNFAVQDNWCAIHATHLSDQEVTALAASRAVVGLCPTTEANLGDGIFPARTFLDQGGAMGIGSDSHITISPSEDLRMLEYSQRLLHRTRNALANGPGQSTGRSLFERALKGGAQALGQNMGAIAVGKRADFVVLNPDHHALIGRSQDSAIDAWIFSGGNSCVRDVYVGGKQVVKDGAHVAAAAITKNFKQTIARLI
ncbi:MAG: formimidoylglutamate deiminase [Alphaproteobacteria bacterium]|nr:formimidoylglutamate deiminase [Alphaproteobacteria bacterium]